MKNFFRFILFCFTIAAVITLFCSRVNAQIPTSPTYTGTLDDKVFIPAVFKGKNYKITGDRVGGSTTNYYGDTISNKDANVAYTVVGSLTQHVAKNGYGYFTYTNNTGADIATAVYVSITYSDTSTNLPIPVITNYAATDDIGINHIITVHAYPYGFDFILKAQVPNGESIILTYNVKGF